MKIQMAFGAQRAYRARGRGRHMDPNNHTMWEELKLNDSPRLSSASYPTRPIDPYKMFVDINQVQGCELVV